MTLRRAIVRAKAPAATLLALLLTAGVVAPARAATIEDLFQQANADYWEGRFEAARDGYHRIVEDYRIDNPEVYYNLANTYVKLDHLGSAVLYYKRALASQPDADTREAVGANLSQVRLALAARHRDTVASERALLDESHGAWYALFHAVPGDTLAVVALALWLALAASLLLRRVTSRPGLRRGLNPAALVLLLLVALAGGLLAGNVATSESVRLAIVIQPDAKLRVSRQPDAPAVTLPEGLELRILSDPDDEWTRVRLGNGREGYVTGAAIKEI
jgi:tetratricopeptide (TPR) repeat protein